MGKNGLWVILVTLMMLYSINKYLIINPVRYDEDNLITVSIETTSNLQTMEAEAKNDDSRILKFMTFNIRSANNKSGSVELERIIEEIRETDADIVGLQEVDRSMPRSGYQDQAGKIAEQLGYHYYYGDNINILGMQYGNALLSKFPILKAINHNLPKVKLEPRGLIEAEIDIDGSLWHVFVTHLGLNYLERQKQMSYINNVISQKDGNIVLLGDFNNYSDSMEMTIMESHLTDSAVKLNCLNQFTFAWKNDVPNVRIDRIYVSDNDNIFFLHQEAMPSEVSDHSRVVLQILLNIMREGGI